MNMDHAQRLQLLFDGLATVFSVISHPNEVLDSVVLIVHHIDPAVCSIRQILCNHAGIPTVSLGPVTLYRHRSRSYDDTFQRYLCFCFH